MRIFYCSLFFLAAPLNAMVSYYHSESETGELRVFLAGEVHDLDTVLQEPGYSKDNLGPLTEFIRGVKLKHTVPLLLELRSDYFRLNASEQPSVMCQELCATYREVLKKEHKPFRLLLMDDREEESETMIGATAGLTQNLTETVPIETIQLFTEKPDAVKDKPDLTKAYLQGTKQIGWSQPSEVTIARYFRCLESQQRSLEELAIRWKHHEKLVHYFSEVLKAHVLYSQKLKELLKDIQPETEIFVALQTLLCRQKTVPQILQVHIDLEAIQDHTDFPFFEAKVASALFELFEQGHKAVALFTGDSHARSLAKLFTDPELLGWKSIEEKTENATTNSFVRKYALTPNFRADVAVAFLNFCIKSEERQNEVVTVPNQCDYCFATSQEAFSKCARCKKAPYCSKECQKKAWPAHKLGCKE